MFKPQLENKMSLVDFWDVKIVYLADRALVKIGVHFVSKQIFH